MHDSLSIPHDSHDREPLGILPLVTEHYFACANAAI